MRTVIRPAVMPSISVGVMGMLPAFVVMVFLLSVMFRVRGYGVGGVFVNVAVCGFGGC